MTWRSWDAGFGSSLIWAVPAMQNRENGLKEGHLSGHSFWALPGQLFVHASGTLQDNGHLLGVYV
jgi:hypothetical protein